MVEFSGLEGVDPQLAEDVKTILEEAGVSREAFDADTDGAKTKVHEFFARGFETDLSEGEAPAVDLGCSRVLALSARVAYTLGDFSGLFLDRVMILFTLCLLSVYSRMGWLVAGCFCP